MALIATGLACLAGSAGAQVSYVLDTGKGNSIGPAFDSYDFVWLNGFAARAGGEVLTQVSVCYGSATAGIPVEIVVLADPDGDGTPAHALQVRSVAGVTNPAGNGVFTTYALPPTRVTGTFFVGVRCKVYASGKTTRPARLDISSAGAGLSANAWLAFGSVTDSNLFLDMSNLGAAPVYYQMSTYAFPGVWMVRAQGEPAPVCAADFNADGFVDIYDFSAYVEAFELGNPAADVNGDAFVDIYDFGDFVSAFESGC